MLYHDTHCNMAVVLEACWDIVSSALALGREQGMSAYHSNEQYTLTLEIFLPVVFDGRIFCYCRHH